MILTLTLVAFGGALGASLRYLFGVAVMRVAGATQFPLAIIGVNVLGSFLMGVFVVVAANRGLTHLSPLVMTGLLGGFTTFSAFSLETVGLIERGQLGLAAAYVTLSVGCSVLGLMLGMILARGAFV
ncbi:MULTISPECIES: fluoride efflux transporter CrcB [Roseobacteraceae]|jgi:CrcB protein|uniref:Fluoride-specific ion channel FluC n=1 Tax=Pseudosulfitobacter pseudonitzschiae TaxID=1402135 RepID=A0A221K3C7_9RHOB|nr:MULTISPECIES: fluoride efflux transporter CrcB [Roseobacteraceae]ASM73373.1 putative fluoride ion transporter CrcB [Pseudosulfitobacter pseudonitzschiae]